MKNKSIYETKVLFDKATSEYIRLKDLIVLGRNNPMDSDKNEISTT